MASVTPKLIVFRIQDKFGRGPFAPGVTHWWIEQRPDRDNLRPFYETWPDLKLDPFHFYYGCACTTIEQLKRWFSASEYSTLKTLGYRAVRLPVDAIECEDATQCVFKRKKELRKGATPIEFY